MLIRLDQLIKGRRGQALVELALILPVLLMLVFGIIEFGRVMGSYLIITQAAREGARAGAVNPTDTAINDAVDNAAAILDSSRLDVTITPDSGSRIRGAALTVRIEYTVDLVAPLFNLVIPDPFPLSARTTMRIE